MAKQKTIEPIDAWFSVNVKKATESSKQAAESLRSKIQEDLDTNTPLRFSMLDYLMNEGAAFGPFEKKEQALMMAPSMLTEDFKDAFGNEWDIIMVSVTKGELVVPNHSNMQKEYMCTNKECKSVQTFKGCCQICRFDGRPYVKTILIRKWAFE